MKKKISYIPLLIGLLILFSADPSLAAESWKLGFDIKASWYPHLERLDIYVDDAKIKQIDANNFLREGANAPTIPQHLDIDLSSYAKLNSRIKIRFYKIAEAGNSWVLLDNVSIMHNGKYVRYTDWTENKIPADTGLMLKQIYGDEQRLVFRKSSADGEVNGKDYAEFISAPLEESAELDIKPSGISFSPETPIATVPKDVTISAKVKNIGGLNTGNTVKMELWINDAKKTETSLFSVSSGSSQTRTFSYNYAGGLDKVEVRVISSDDARVNNNKAVRYLTPAKPYILFKDFSATPISKYAANEPYKSWKTQILTNAKTYLSSPGIDGGKIRTIAFAYLLTNDKSYADAATNALLNINTCDGTSFVDHPYLDCERSLNSYTQSFDFLREYIYSSRNTDYPVIQEKLASMASDVKWRAFNNYAYDFIETFPRKAMLGDINNHLISENSVLISVSSGLLDYHGDKIDYLDAPNTAGISARNLFEESYVGSPLPVARLVNGEGGYGIQGGYRFQNAGFLADGMVNYNSVFGVSPVKKYPLARGVLDMPVWHTIPAGCEPPEKGQASGSSSWGEEYLLTWLFEGQDRINHQWYIDNVLTEPYCSQAVTADVVSRALLYDNSYKTPLKPSWGPTDSYFSKENAIAILRNGYAPDFDATYLRLVGHKDPVWGNAQTSHSYQGSYTMWSKNAYLIAERGDERGFSTWPPNHGGFGYSSFIFNDNLAFSTLEQFGTVKNPSILESFMSSSNIDAAHVKTKINQLTDVSTDTANSVPRIEWERSVLFPSMEYYIIMDKLTSDTPYDFDMTVHYGGTEPDTSAALYDSRYPVIGNLTIGGQKVGWWSTSETVTKSTNSVRWSTKSLSAMKSKIPQPQHDVELITFIAPMTSITNQKAAQQFGDYTKPGGYMWHPYIRSRQSGTTVKYLTVQYPRDMTALEVEPSIKQIAVTGGSGNDYSLKITRGKIIDIASIGDGELITAENMKTDAESAFSRFDGSLKYFIMKNGSTFSYNGSDKVQLSKRLQYFVLNYYGDNNFSFKVKGSGSVDILIKGIKTSNFTIKLDGMPFKNYSIIGTDLKVTTFLSDHEFEVTPGSSSKPAPTPTVTPLPTPAPTPTVTPTPAPLPVSGTIYSFDVESGPGGWGASGLWHITSNKYNSSSHSFWYGKESTMNYATGGANSGSLTSPYISLVNISKPILSFMSWYQTETYNPSRDKKFVQISVNNGSWTNLKQISHTAKAWVNQQIDLSTYVNKKIRIRFYFNTVDGNYNNYQGWYIDDIRIKGG